METLGIIILLIVIIFLGKFIYDTYLTNNTELKFEEYRKKDPIGASQIEPPQSEEQFNDLVEVLVNEIHIKPDQILNSAKKDEISNTGELLSTQKNPQLESYKSLEKDAEKMIADFAKLLYHHSSKFNQILMHRDYPLEMTKERELELKIIVINEIFECLEKSYKNLPIIIYRKFIEIMSFEYNDILFSKYRGDEFIKFIYSRQSLIKFELKKYDKENSKELPIIYPHILYNNPLVDIKSIDYSAILEEGNENENIIKRNCFVTGYFFMKEKTEKIISSSETFYKSIDENFESKPKGNSPIIDSNDINSRFRVIIDKELRQNNFYKFVVAFQ